MGRQPFLVFSPPPPKNNTRMKKFEPRDGKKCASWKPWWFDHESLCHLDIGISATVNSFAALDRIPQVGRKA